MNAAIFSDALGKVKDSYIMEAAAYTPKRQSVRPKWGALAACLCLVLALAVYGISKLPGPSTAVPMYGVLAQIEEDLGAGQYRAKITGGDENFAVGDTVLIRSDGQDIPALKVGDIVAVTYSSFEKAGALWAIIPGQVELVPAGNTAP